MEKHTLNTARIFERILVRAPNWVGDAVMATPFFGSLRRTFPEAAITCLCRPLVADIFRYNPDINHVRELDETFGRSGWKAIRANAARLKGEPFDLAISLPNSLSSALIFFFARIPERVGYRGDWRRIMLTRSMTFPKKGDRPHRVESYLRLLDLVAEPVHDRKLRLVIDGQSATAVDETLRALNLLPPTRFVALAPGAAQPNKMWMPDRFAALAQRLLNDGLGVVLVGGPNERELCERVAGIPKASCGASDSCGPDLGQGFKENTGQSDTASMTKVMEAPNSDHALPTHSNRIVNLAGAGPLLFTAEIIRRSAAFIGNDSGLAHVAAAVGTPVVVLSGPGDPTEVVPYSERAVTIAKTLFCKPCYRNYCWRKDKPLECLELIEVEEVYAASESITCTSEYDRRG